MHDEAEKHRALVLACNEIYHDLEGQAYDKIHPEIMEREKKRWELTGARFLNNDQRRRTWIDIGSGTGFVGMQLAKYVQPGDIFICTDISKTMLDIATKNVRNVLKNIEVRGVKLSDESLPFPDASADVITMNSVLHHIPNVSVFLREIERVLAPNGILIIGHEPNARYRKNTFLQKQEKRLHLLHPKRVLMRLLTRSSEKNPQEHHDHVLDAINAELQKRTLIETPLSRSTLALLVDVHSPTAGGIKRDEGFEPETLLITHTVSIELLQYQTYNHLGKLSGRHALYAVFEFLMRLLFPRDGATFFLVGRKVSSTLRYAENMKP